MIRGNEVAEKGLSLVDVNENHATKPAQEPQKGIALRTRPPARSTGTASGRVLAGYKFFRTVRRGSVEKFSFNN
jgi:hypothetical protein